MYTKMKGPFPIILKISSHVSSLEGALREYTRALERAVEDSAEEEAAILMVDRLHRKLQRHDAETKALARLSSFAPPPQIRPAP